jgi:hypothetical protein
MLALSKGRLKLNELMRGDRIFRVQSDVETIRAIVTIFNICCIDKPSTWNVLVCSPTTVVSEIMNFVIRAQTVPLQTVCPFIIADF